MRAVNATESLGQQLIDGALGHVQRWRYERAPTGRGALVNGQVVIGGLGEGQANAGFDCGHANAPLIVLTSWSMCSRVRSSVIATSSWFSSRRSPGLTPASRQTAIT